MNRIRMNSMENQIALVSPVCMLDYARANAVLPEMMEIRPEGDDSDYHNSGIACVGLYPSARVIGL